MAALKAVLEERLKEEAEEGRDANAWRREPLLKNEEEVDEATPDLSILFLKDMDVTKLAAIRVFDSEIEQGSEVAATPLTEKKSIVYYSTKTYTIRGFSTLEETKPELYASLVQARDNKEFHPDGYFDVDHIIDVCKLILLLSRDL